MISVVVGSNFMEEALHSLPVGLLQSTIVVVVTLVVRVFIVFLRDKSPGRRIWNLDRSKSTHIVITTGRIRDDNEFTDTVYPAEARAAAEIELYLRLIYPKMIVRVTTSEAATGEDLKGNLIVIGGPNHNRISRRILDSLVIPFEFGGHDLVKQDGRRWSASLDSSGNIERDSGLIVRTNNRFSPSGGSMFLIAGCRTFGCLIGSRSLVRSDTKRTGKFVKALTSWAIVVTGDVYEQEVLGVEVSDVTDLKVVTND